MLTGNDFRSRVDANSFEAETAMTPTRLPDDIEQKLLDRHRLRAPMS